MASKNMKKNTMTCRLAIFGTELTSEVSAIFKLLFFEMIFRGLKILKIRSDLTAEMLTPGGIRNPATAERTITKSRQFQASRKYVPFTKTKPKAMIFVRHSSVNAPVMK